MSWIRQTMRSTLALALPRSRLVVRGPAGSREVCLTFDDGPDPEHTPEVLDQLKRYGVRATFFVVGRQVERHPDLLWRIAAEGHAIGQHTYRHAEPRDVSARALLDEVRQTEEVVARVVGYRPRLFRPPKGELTVGKLGRLLQAGLTVVLWNVDPKDYGCADAASLRRWFAARGLRGGDVVLLHDVKPYAAEVIGDLARAARRDGLKFVVPDEWCGREAVRQSREVGSI